MKIVANINDALSDLHASVDQGISTIEFRFAVAGRQVCVDVTRETLSRCFGVHDGAYGLLEAYEANRLQIDAAVRQRGSDGGKGVVDVRPQDLGTMLPVLPCPRQAKELPIPG
jgi:hypothetical protein